MKTFAVIPLLLAVLLTLSPFPAVADEGATGKMEAIREMIRVMGVDNLSDLYGATMTEQIYQVLQTSRPELPPEALSIIREEVGKLLDQDRDKLLEQIVGIYDKAFTEGEVRELTAFYQTELGHKTVVVIPQIMQESMALGKSWGKSIGPQLMANLEARFKKDKEDPGK